MNITREKISKEIEDLNRTIYHLDLADIYRILYPVIAEHIFSSNAHEAFSRIYNVLDHKKMKPYTICSPATME